MDIFYFGDCVPYASMRSGSYRDFEKFPIGSLEQSSQVKSAYCIAQAKTNAHCHKDKPVKKDNCPFCKEKKKKPLASYIRRRELCKRTESICEEEEEDEEEEVTEEQNHEREKTKTENHPHTHDHVPDVVVADKEEKKPCSGDSRKRSTSS